MRGMADGMLRCATCPGGLSGMWGGRRSGPREALERHSRSWGGAGSASSPTRVRLALVCRCGPKPTFALVCQVVCLGAPLTVWSGRHACLWFLVGIGGTKWQFDKVGRISADDMRPVSAKCSLASSAFVALRCGVWGLAVWRAPNDPRDGPTLGHGGQLALSRPCCVL